MCPPAVGTINLPNMNGRLQEFHHNADCVISKHEFLRLYQRKAQGNGKLPLPVLCANGAAHAFRQELGDGQTQASGAAAGLDGVEAIKEPPGCDGGEACRCIGKGNGSLLVHIDGKVLTAVFEGVSQNVAENTTESRGVQASLYSAFRKLNFWGDALLLHRAVERQEGFFQCAPEIQGDGDERLGRGGYGVTKQLLCQLFECFGPVLDLRQVPGCWLRQGFLLQEIQVAANGGERGAQTMGNARNGVLSRSPRSQRRRWERSVRSWALMEAARLRIRRSRLEMSMRALVSDFKRF